MSKTRYANLKTYLKLRYVQLPEYKQKSTYITPGEIDCMKTAVNVGYFVKYAQPCMRIFLNFASGDQRAHCFLLLFQVLTDGQTGSRTNGYTDACSETEKRNGMQLQAKNKKSAKVACLYAE
ncbi:unnamed protein product [Nesidiocoris tenuis]|uniref:Uncharacterized protein n=1 Tax=Nesidiocoris tenuis TaxID=355587 RepID=A0A6H5HBB3_9HEMI|nr:unnamed protein product [Nesidiocoris tenuis]